jgi:hypothetical protein
MTDAGTIAAQLRHLRSRAADASASIDEADLDRRLRDARTKRRGRGGMRLNLTPMIDVTFLLLVFFVCTTKALEKEGLLRADLSERGGAMPADALALDEPPLRMDARACAWSLRCRSPRTPRSSASCSRRDATVPTIPQASSRRTSRSSWRPRPTPRGTTRWPRSTPSRARATRG